MGQITRRELMVHGTAALALLGHNPAWAQARELIANTYGGPWETAHRHAIAEPLEKRLGIKVTLVSMLANELITRTKAAVGGRPPVDVALVDDGPFLHGIKEDVFVRVPADKVPHAAKIFGQYRPKEPYGVPLSASVIGIAYNAKKLKVAPTSWADLWRPEYKGRLGLITPASTLGTVALVSLAKIKGGDETRIDPGFEAVKSLLPSVGAIAATPANLQTLLERGEVDIAPSWHSNALFMRGKGIGIEFALPKEGGIAGLAWLAITKGANVDLAAAYLDQGLSPEGQKMLAASGLFLGPTIEGVTLPPEIRNLVPTTPADFARFVSLDWSKINPVRAEWINRWNREIKV